jgi:predicted Zn-dependent protease
MLAAALTLGGCMAALDRGSLLGTAIEQTPENEGFDAREVALGQREHPRIVAGFGGIYADPDLQAYLDNLVVELRGSSDRPDLGYRVTVLNSPSINAFSLPGGYIYVTRGLLALANDTSEIAAVLAHEMAHITARHAIQREEQAVSATILGQVIADVARGPEAGAAALALTRGRLAQFSRQQELEADAIGIRTAARAGYDPNGAITFLRGLERQTQLHSRSLHQEYDPGRVDLFSSHPATPQRILAAEREARLVEERGTYRRDRNAYLEVINGLAYGDDPREGFVQGRTFIHPQLGINFTVPPGFALENTPRAVVGFSDTGDIIRFDTVNVGRSESLVRYLSEDAVRGGDVSDVEEREIGGLPAAIARVRGDSWQFQVAAIRGQDDTVYRFILAARELDAQRVAALVDTADSFRLLPAEEAQRARQQRLRIVTVQPGETVEQVAARMDFTDFRVERFRALNGLSPSDRLRAGEHVKIVVR